MNSHQARTACSHSNALLRLSGMAVACFCAAMTAETHAQDAKPKPPAPHVQRSVMIYRFLPEFQLHFDIDTALAAEIAQALDIPGREPEVKAILEHAAKRHAQLLVEGKKRIGEVGENEGNELFKEWHQTYDGISRESDPEKFEEGQAAKAKLDERHAELCKPIRREMQQVLIEAETVLDETTFQLAELSPIEKDVAQSRVRLAILRRSIMRHPPGSYYGDFQRPMDVRDFIAFAAHCDEHIAGAFRLEADPDAWANPPENLAKILAESDAAMLEYLNTRVDRRRTAQLSDDAPRQKGLSPWARANDVPHAIVNRLGTALDELDPPVGEAWRALFHEYLCPELTGFWPADVLIAAAHQQKDAMPVATFEALSKIELEYGLERQRVVSDAIALGIVACREHNSAVPGKHKNTQPEQQLFLDKLAQAEALSDRTVIAVIAIFEGDPDFAHVLAALEDVREKLDRSGGGPWVRDHVRQHARTTFNRSPDYPAAINAATARHRE